MQSPWDLKTEYASHFNEKMELKFVNSLQRMKGLMDGQVVAIIRKIFTKAVLVDLSNFFSDLFKNLTFDIENMETGDTMVRLPTTTGDTMVRLPTTTGDTMVRLPTTTGDTMVRLPTTTEDFFSTSALEFFLDMVNENKDKNLIKLPGPLMELFVSSERHFNQVQVLLEQMGVKVKRVFDNMVKSIEPASLEMSALDKRMADTALDINFINQILQLNKKSKLQ